MWLFTRAEMTGGGVARLILRRVFFPRGGKKATLLQVWGRKGVNSFSAIGRSRRPSLTGTS